MSLTIKVGFSSSGMDLTKTRQEAAAALAVAALNKTKIS
jgi:hypothetical protein